MRFLYVFQCFMVVFALAMPAAAQTATLSGFGKLLWGPPQHDETRPTLLEAKIPHNSQWADENWSPQEWIDDRGSAEAVIDGFYKSGIITDQYFDEDVPVLEVGDRFMDLSEQEQRRVTAFIDHVYNVTGSSAAGVYMIASHRRDDPIGLFSKQGLQFQ